jgi:arginyl-tRNA--protein-N-Asp/Glu arginylyltransferase
MRNSDLNARTEPAVATAEHYRLFIDYESSRHADSDMARMTYADFVEMIEDGGVDSALMCLRDGHGILHGAMLVDRVGTSNSAVYSYFRVLDPRRSLGTQLVVRRCGNLGGRWQVPLSGLSHRPITQDGIQSAISAFRGVSGRSLAAVLG